MAELSAADFGGPQELDASAFNVAEESPITRARRVLKDPEGGILPAAGSLIDSVLPSGGPDQGWLGDTAVDLARAPVTHAQTLAGIGNLITGGLAGKALDAVGFNPRQAQEGLAAHYSDSRKAQMQELADAGKRAEQKVADASGILDTTKAALSGAGDIAGTMIANPGLIQDQIIQTAPDMLLGAGIVGSAGKRILAKGGEEALGAASNKLSWLGHGIEGAQAAGQNAEQIRENNPDNLAGQYLQVPAGVLTGLIGRGASKIPGFGDVQTAAQLALAGPKGAAQRLLASGSPAAQIVKGMISEGLFQELPQSAQEQVWQNLAEGKAWDEGVLTAGVQGAVTGAAMGGGMGGINAMANKPAETASPAPATDQELDQANASLAGAINPYEAVDGLPQLGYDPAASVIEVPTQGGGTATIDRNAGPLSAAVVDSGAADMLASGTLLPSYPSRFAAQAALNQRQDAADMEIAPHPSAAMKGRFAVVPKPVPVLDANQQAIERQAQLQEEEDTATERTVTLNKQAAAIEKSITDNTPPSEAEAARRKASALRAAANESAQEELAPPAAQPVTELPGVQQQNASLAGQAQVANETRAAQLVDEEASAANPEPTDAQIAAGNYKKGHVKVGPLDISIENPAGSTRKGPGWQVQMQDHYGYVKRTAGADGDQVDVYVKQGTPTDFNGTVYVVDQFNPETGRFDEHKAMIGYRNHAEAARAYDSHFQDKSGPKRRSAVVAVPMETFARWAKEGDTTRPLIRAAAEQDAAQAEIEASTGKLSAGRQKGETQEQYHARKAAESNAKKRARRNVEPAPADDTLTKTLGDDATPVQAKDLPNQSETTGNQLSRQVANTIEQIARLFKKKVVFFKSEANTDGFWIEGNTIYIHADNPKSGIAHLHVLGHELTHAMKAEARAAYDAMFEAVKGLLTDEEIRAQWLDYKGEELVGEITDAQRDFIAEEWMADLSGNRFGEADFWQNVFEAIEAKHGGAAKGIIARLRLALVNAINKVVSVLRGNKFAVDERLAGDLDQIRAAVTAGFTQYAEAVKTGKLETATGGEAKFSTLPSRWPTSKKATPSVADAMLADLETLRQTPDLLEKAVNALVEEPGLKTRAKSTDGKLNAVLDRLVSNLLWLHDQVPAEIRKRSKLWYDGANVIAKNWADQYGKTPAQTAGILAVLSPQKDWFMNVTMAERVLDILSSQMAHRFDEKMKGAAFQFLLKDQQKPADKRANTAAFDLVKDKTLGQVVKTNNLLAIGVWLRAYDEAHNAAEHAVIHPEGDFGENATTVSGSQTLRAWGGFEALGKAASIFTDGSPENINAKLGGEHKVRNFYNNIFNPKDARFATIDTHAVAADMIRPLAGADKPVADNFGASGGSNLTGVSGTYPIHFEAYKRAAEARGILPREMQSITWEAVRGLFTEGFKGKKDNLAAVDNVWRQVDAGKLTAAEARDRILGMANGIEHPDWWAGGEPEMSGRGKSYVPQRPAFAGTKIAFEVAPDPNDKALTQRWNGLPDTAKAEISYDLAWDTAAKVLAYYNSDTLKGELHTQTGGYLDETNPSFSLWMNKYASAVKVQEITSLLGYALKQDSMVIGSPKSFKGATQMGVVVVKGVSDANAKKVYDDLRSAIRADDGSPLIDGHTTAEDHMSILVPLEDRVAIAQRVAVHLGDRHDVGDGTYFVQWPERGENEYGLLGKQAPGGAAAAGTPLQAYADQLRSETERELERRISAVKRSGGRSTPAGQDRLSNIRVGQGGRVDVSGIHFSKAQRDHLSGVFFGTGTKSEEARRLFESKDSRLKSRLYAYVDEGKGVRPEEGVGGHAHRVQLDNLYDLKADPLGIRSKIRDANERESAILDAGFNGYYAPGVFGDQGVAILMGGAAIKGVAPDAYLGIGYRGGEAPPARKAAPNPIAESRTLPAGRMSGAEWKRLLPNADLSALEDGKDYYKDDVARKVKLSAGRQTETPEFKKWFGDWDHPKAFTSRFPADKTPPSMAMDWESNKPLVLFHATNSDFNTFETGRDSITSTTFGPIDTRRHAIFATPDVGFAESYLKKGGGQNVMPVYMNIKAPMDLRNNGAWNYVDELVSNGFENHRWPNRSDTEMWEMFDDETGEEFVAAAKQAGYDGAIMYELNDDNKMVEVYVAFDPIQIKSAIGNRGTFDGTNPDIRASAGRQPVFYSQLARSIEQAPDKVFGLAGQVKLWLAGNAGKLGIKQDEIQWSGINDWLDLQGKKKVSRQDVLGYLEQGGVQVVDVLKGDKGYDEDKPELPPGQGLRVIDATDREGFEVLARNGRVIGYSPDNEEDAISDAYMGHPEYWERGEETKYHQYVLPGGENYRELLLTLPPRQGPRPDTLATEMFGRRFNDLGPADQNAVRDALKRNDLNFRSAHWQEPNILAHVRMNDRTDADGKRVLFIEELQSDWGQEGKKKGFRAKVAPEDAPLSYADPAHQGRVTIGSRLKQAQDIRASLPALRDAAVDAMKRIYATLGVPDTERNEKAKEVLSDESRWPRVVDAVLGEGAEAVTAYFDAKRNAELWEREADRLRRLYAEEINSMRSTVPSAPFVTHTETWLGLALKRIMRYAADNGYDKVAFINGEQSAERYDLSKQVKAIDYIKRGDKYELAYETHDGQGHNPGEFTAEQLPDVVGKEVAEKIINGDGRNYRGREGKTLEGLDLKVGGEGMKAFYDKIVPQRVSALLKKLGGTVETISIPNPEKWKATLPQLGFTVPASAAEPMPLFSPGRFSPTGNGNYLRELKAVLSHLTSPIKATRDKAGASIFKVMDVPPVIRNVIAMDGSKPFKRVEQGIWGSGNSIVSKATDTHAVSDHGGAVDTAVLLKLPQYLADPIAVFSSEGGTNPNSYRVVVPGAIVAIEPKGLRGFVMTVHPQSQKQLSDWAKAGLLHYVDEKAAQKAADSEGLSMGQFQQFPSSESSSLTDAQSGAVDWSMAQRAAEGKGRQVMTKEAISGLPEAALSRGRVGQLIDRTITNLDHAVDGLSNLPNQFDYLKDRYLALGKIARVDEIVKEIRHAFTKTDPANKKAVYDYLTTRGATPAAIPDPAIRAMAERIKKTINYVGDQLVARGLLDQQARDHYRDQYLPRMYLRHMLNDQDFKVIGMGKKPSDMGYLKHRKDIPPEIREVVLGEVKDPAFLSASAIGRAMRDVALLDWMAKISQNNDWVFPDIFVNWKGKRVTAYWLRAEADRIQNQAQHYEPEAKQKAEALVAAMRQTATNALGNMSHLDHQRYKQVPDTMRYGLLRGMWLRNEVYNDIMGASQIVNADPTWFEDWFGFGGKGTQLTQWWKFTKVALNPPGQIRNFISNMVMLQLSGVGLHKLPGRVIEAARDVSNNGPYWKVAKKYGVTESTFTAQEMFRIKRDLIALEAQSGKLNKMRWLMAAGAKFLDSVSNLYQFSEALGKTIKIIDEMKKGKSEAEAALEAQKWLFDYSLVPQSVRIARNAPVGMPFLTYQVKVLPRLLEVAAKYPWRFLPWAGLLYGMQAAVASMFGVDDDELKKLKKSLPEWLQDRGHTVFLPIRDADGRLQVADVGYFFPWTFYSQTGKHLAEGNLKKGLVDDIGGQFSAPIIGAAAALMANYDSFTKQPIYKEADPISYQAASIANYAYDLMAPPFLSSHGFISPMGLADKKFGGKIVQAETGTTNKFGDPKATEAQAIAGLVGVNFYGMDPEHTRITNLQVMQRKTLEAEKALRQRLMDRSLTPEDKARVISDYRDRMMELNMETMRYAQEAQVPEQLRVRR